MAIKRNYRDLISDINLAEIGLMQLRARLHNLPGYAYIQAAESNLVDDFFLREGEALSKELIQRDWPMTRDEIKEVFKISGFHYLESDIDACSPDSLESKREYEQEQRCD